MSFPESAFQAQLLRALNAPGSGMRVWRQQAGKLRVVDSRGQRWVHCAPAGAADLVGYVQHDGWLLEVEVKAPNGRQRPEQKRREAQLTAAGAIYVLVAAEHYLTPRENVEAAVQTVQDAIRTRRGTK